MNMYFEALQYISAVKMKYIHTFWYWPFCNIHNHQHKPAAQLAKYKILISWICQHVFKIKHIIITIFIYYPTLYKGKHTLMTNYGGRETGPVSIECMRHKQHNTEANLKMLNQKQWRVDESVVINTNSMCSEMFLYSEVPVFNTQHSSGFGAYIICRF